MSKRACVFIIVFLYGECSGKFLSFNVKSNLEHGQYKPINNGPLPAYWDWRETGDVTPVKNQLDCNACWAFSIVAAIESHLGIYKHQTATLSEQFLIDCAKDSAGCSNTSILETFGDIVTDLGGVLLDEGYCKYVAAKRHCSCRRDDCPSYIYNLVPVVGFKRVHQDEDEMAKYIYHYGPLSAGINPASMEKYTNGIDQPTNEQCPPDQRHHAVLIVGYNVYVSGDGKTRIPYWIIKNSWGEEWGDKGFYYLERGRNACGIAEDVSFPFVQ